MPRGAFSYERCSNPDQIKGNTKQRQAELRQTRGADYCRRHDLTLDTTHTFSDWGISSFHGDNITKGALGAFLLAIEKKIIRKGDVLIVESIDRLTRLPLDDADQLLRRILKSGVSILTLSPEYELTPDDLNDLGKRMMMLAACEVAHRSSADKSKWLSAVWAKLRQDAHHRKITKRCPYWLELSQDRSHFILRPEAVKTIKLIFRQYLDGLGAHTITRRLNQDNIPNLGTKRQGTWHVGSVTQLLSNIAVTGRYQLHKGPHTDSKPVGDPIPNYFPQIISDDDFSRAQRRKKLALIGRPPKRFATLFPRLIRDARDKSIMANIHNGQEGHYRLVSSDARRGIGGKYLSFPYQQIEDAFIRFVTELSLDDISPPREAATTDELESRQLRLDDLDRRIEKTKKRLDDDPNLDMLLDTLARWSAERREAAAELERLRTQNTSGTTAVLNDTQQLAEALKAAKGEKRMEIRLRLRARIAELVKEIWILPYDVEVPKAPSHKGTKKQRVADVQVFFRAGGVQQLCISGGKACRVILPFVTYTADGKMAEVEYWSDLRDYNARTYGQFWYWVKDDLTAKQDEIAKSRKK
ncbi:MAG: recombinase family protein [Thermoguttaceae bacterium]